MRTNETIYQETVRGIADDIVRQLEDGDAARRRTMGELSAGGKYFEAVRVFYADVYPVGEIPRGVARIALDVSPTHARRPSHEVRVSFEASGVYIGEAAADIAAAVLDMIDSTADYAR